MPSTKTIIVGLSGPSSSGKTTLGRLLRSVFNTDNERKSNHIHTSLFILHSDDFYKRDTDIPQRQISSPEHGTREIQDWDCVEAIDLPRLQSTLQYIAIHGVLPPGTESKEEQNNIGDSRVPSSEIKQHQTELIQYLSTLPQPRDSDISEIQICILDGFLLYPPPPSVPKSKEETETSAATLSQLYDLLAPLLTLKLFLSSTREQTIERRAARAGYVTMEGFWTDPPGYVEDLVWVNYARDHGWLFSSQEDVDKGIVNREIAEREGVLVAPGQGDIRMSEILSWGVDVLKDMVKRIVDGNRE